MEIIKPGVNTGVIIQAPRAGSWIQGQESGLVKEVIEASGQFDVYLPDEESQFRTDEQNVLALDTSACVTFSGTNDIETLINRIRAKGLMPKTHETFLQLGGYINKQSGKVNFSDRFTAKMSGTTQAGNYLEAVGDSIRRDGLLPESDWAFPDMSDIMIPGDFQKRWDRYYAEIPNDLKEKAKKFKEYFQINYEWVILGTSDNAKLKASLVYGPVQIAAAVCSPWSSNDGMPPIPACGCGAGHATLVYGYNDTGAIKDFDSYKSYRKLLAADYCIQWGFQYALKPITLPVATPFHYTFTQQLKFGMGDTAEVRNMQRALQTLRRQDGKPYMTPGVFGPFGPQTKTALGLFQTDKGIKDPDGQGTNFGPSTRKAMNLALNG